MSALSCTSVTPNNINIKLFGSPCITHITCKVYLHPQNAISLTPPVYKILWACSIVQFVQSEGLALDMTHACTYSCRKYWRRWKCDKYCTCSILHDWNMTTIEKTIASEHQNIRTSEHQDITKHCRSYFLLFVSRWRLWWSIFIHVA